MIQLAPEHTPIIEFGLPERTPIVPRTLPTNQNDKEMRNRNSRSETGNRRNKMRGRVGQAVNNALRGVSATITTGTDQSKGFSQLAIVLLGGLFLIFTFGGLFRK